MIQHNNKLDNSSGQVVFTCPAVSILRELQKEIAELKRLTTAPTSSTPDDVLDNAELMTKYKISRTTAADWRNNGLQHYRVRGKLIHKRSDIEAFLQKYKHRAF